MKTRCIKEEPLFTLYCHHPLNGTAARAIWRKDLIESKVGDEFVIEHDEYSSTFSDEEDVLKVVYKDENGVACIHRTIYSVWQGEDTVDVELIWFELH